MHHQRCQQEASEGLCVAELARKGLTVQSAHLEDSYPASDVGTVAQEDIAVSAQGLLSTDGPAPGRDTLVAHPGRRMEWEDVGKEKAREQALNHLENANHAGKS